MNISIRILNLPNEIITKLDEQSIKVIFDLIRADLAQVLSEKESLEVRKVLKDYKKKELKKELQGLLKKNPYEYLDKDYPLSEMNFSLRTINALNNSSIMTVSRLLTLIEEVKIYGVENLGTKSIIQLMTKLNEVVLKEKLNEVIPIYQKTHPSDQLPVEKLGFSQGAISSLHNLGIFNLGKLRELYLAGKLLDLFSYKTLKVILEEFEKYYTDFPNSDYSYFKTLLIEEYLGRISISEIEEIGKRENISFKIREFLTRLAEKTDLIISADEVRLPYFSEKLKEVNLKKESEEILIERFSGSTLQTVADKFHKTRERIRQIVRDRMSHISMFYEESFIKEYNKFVWHPQVFKKIFALDDFSFNIVKYLGHKFTFEEAFVFPEEYVLELIASNKVQAIDLEAFKDSLPEVFNERMEIYGKIVPKMTKRLFLEYVIEHFVPDEGLHKNKIVQIAEKVATDNKLDYHYDKYIDIVSNTIQGLQNVRFYDYNRLTPELIEELKKIIYEIDSVYSCNYFYHKYPKLMKKVDIRDGYELHFVLRRYFSSLEEFKGKVDFNRQPMLAVHGKTYADVVKENWNNLNSPIKLEIFTKNLIKKYGYHSGTLVNIINSTLGDYISLKIVYNFKPSLNEATLSKIKEIMKDEFYELSELAGIFKKAGIEPGDYQYFSNFWLNDLGYKTHDVNYIIKQEYSSLKEIFFKKVLSEDVYTITKKDRKIRETTLILFIETLRQEYLAFQYKKDKLINRRQLEKQGLKIQDIEAYVKALSRIIPKNRYFTYESLVKEKNYLEDPAVEKLESMKLDKELIINFIRNIPSIKKTTKGNLFRISKEQSTVNDFMEEVRKETGLDDEKLKDYILKYYDFKIR
jgi:hypothetical protein